MSTVLKFVTLFIVVISWLVIATAPLQADMLVSDNFGNQILRFDQATGDFIDVLVSAEPNQNGGLSGPVGMAVDANGDLLVASQNTNSILKYDVSDGAFLGEFASVATGVSLAGPAGIRFGSDGNLYVANFFGNSVDVIGPDGTGMGAFTQGGPGIAGTSSFAFGPNGNIYVASFNSGDIQIFSGVDGSFIEVFASSLSGASGLTFDAAGNLWAASLFTHDISQFDINGMPLTTFSTGDGTFPSHILISDEPSPQLRIALTGAAGIFRFDPSGTPLGPFAFGGGLTVPGESLVVQDIIIGDVNGDGVVDLLDVAPFVDALVGKTFIAAADVNQDGVVDLLDVAPFVELIAGN